MLDQILLQDTLQKINTSLNKRFEKDAELYISKQDEYELKKHICNNAFGAVMDMIKGKNISPEIAIKVLIRNAGIITINVSSFEIDMKSILESVKYKTVTYMMEDVLNNKIYMERDLKYLLFKYYINGIIEKKKLSYWNSNEYNFDATERKILFYSILEKSQKTKEGSILNFKIDFIIKSFKLYPILLQNKDTFLVLKETLVNSDKQKLFELLCNEIEAPSICDELYNYIVLNAYISYGNKAFEYAVNKIKKTSCKNYKQYIRVIARMFVKEKNKADAIKMFDTMVKIFESSDIKHHVKERINDKIWKETKKNQKLYEAKKAKIDQLLANTEQKSNKKYTIFEDIIDDIKKGEIERRVAYYWSNMKKKEFKRSLIDSFKNTPKEYEKNMKNIYKWIFSHSRAKGGTETLCQTCDIIALAILENGDLSGTAKYADQFLLDNVLKYSVKGNYIKTYLANYHFDEYKNKYVD